MVKRLNRYNGEKGSRSYGLGRLKARGLTLVETIVVLMVIAFIIMFALALTAEWGAKRGAQNAACESNLKQIGIAFRISEGDHDDLFPMSYFTNREGTKMSDYVANPCRYFQVMSNELNNPKILVCPSDDRTFAADFDHLNNNNVSYFTGLDADETHPPLILSGDRNLVMNGVDVVTGLIVIRTNDAVGWSSKMHNRSGYIVLADGSVQRTDGSTFQSFLIHTGTNMNRLAVP